MAKKNGKTAFIVSTTLGKTTHFNGKLKFKDSLKIDGRFQGRIESQGALVIEKGAMVEADILVGSVIIGGTVKGNIKASKKLEMLSTGRVIGNIETAALTIADGVVFEGKCEMIPDPDKINIFSDKVDAQKARALSR
ncbi:MAG: polymer-forming cytoskeletal protein [Spirochaetales bacterium]|nr:polymer-forming cytoskeletal protein [Spirochaetales bacterium]